MNSKKGMLFLIMIIVASVLTGCHGSMRSNVVLNNNSHVMNTYAVTNNDSNVDNNMKLNLKGEISHYSNSYININDNTDITFDAEIKMTSMPVTIVKTVPYYFSPQDVKKWVDILFCGNKPYKYEPQTSNNNELEDPDWFFSPDSAFFEYGDSSEYDLSQALQQIKVFTDINGEMAFVDCKKCQRDDFILNTFMFWIQDGYQKEELKETKEEVIEYVDSLLQELGLKDKWMIQNCYHRSYKKNKDGNELFNTEGYYYSIDLIPQYENCEVLPQEQRYYIPNGLDYSYRYYYESLNIRYSKGHVVFLEYGAPLEVVDKLSVNTDLLSLEEAIHLFLEHVENEFISTDNSDSTKTIIDIKIFVTKILFGLTRIRINENKAEYLMLPVWDFRGGCTIHFNDGSTYSTPGSPIENPSELLMIDAIDGLVVDFKLGY